MMIHQFTNTALISATLAVGLLTVDRTEAVPITPSFEELLQLEAQSAVAKSAAGRPVKPEPSFLPPLPLVEPDEFTMCSLRDSAGLTPVESSVSAASGSVAAHVTAHTQLRLPQVVTALLNGDCVFIPPRFVDGIFRPPRSVVSL